MAIMSDIAVPTLPVVTVDNFAATTDPVATDGHFAAHHHPVDQLVWVQRAGARIRVDATHWRVGPAQFVWIPANAEHELWMEGGDAVLSLYLHPSLRPDGQRWQRPLVLPVADLAGSIMQHLCSGPQPLPRVRASYALMRDILENTIESADVLAMPTHPAARRVAESLIANPASALSLDDWARELGVSSKTVLRGFVGETGTTFGQWRTRARAYRAAQLLAEGWSVQDVATEVGYATATGFIKAYRSVYSTTPAAHTARRGR